MEQILVILAPILVLAAATDICSQRIPNWLTFPAIITGVIYHSFTAGIQGCLLSAAGVLLGMAFFLPFYLKGGTGAGDVKLMGAVGGFLGPVGVFYAFLFSSIAGGIYAVLLLLRHGLFKETFMRYWYMLSMFLVQQTMLYIPPRDEAGMPVLRFGVAIAVGTIGSILADLSGF
jgi:prepilin peptidase CpaA